MGNCINTITFPATPDAVWNRIRDFHDTSWANGVVTSLDKVGDKGGGEIGAKRVINKAFQETLMKLDDANMTFSYSIDDGPEPVSKDSVENYVGTVTVSAGSEPGTTKVDWNSEFSSKQDQAVADFCNPIYGALLQALKKSFER